MPGQTARRSSFGQPVIARYTYVCACGLLLVFAICFLSTAEYSQQGHPRTKLRCNSSRSKQPLEDGFVHREGMLRTLLSTANSTIAQKEKMSRTTTTCTFCVPQRSKESLNVSTKNKLVPGATKPVVHCNDGFQLSIHKGRMQPTAHRKQHPRQQRPTSGPASAPVRRSAPPPAPPPPETSAITLIRCSCELNA